MEEEPKKKRKMRREKEKHTGQPFNQRHAAGRITAGIPVALRGSLRGAGCAHSVVQRCERQSLQPRMVPTTTQSPDHSCFVVRASEGGVLTLVLPVLTSTTVSAGVSSTAAAPSAGSADGVVVASL